METLSRRLAQLKQLLLEFDFETVYRLGIKHLTTNFLFRLDTEGKDETDLEDDTPVLTLTKVQAIKLDPVNEDVPVLQKNSTPPETKESDNPI